MREWRFADRWVAEAPPTRVHDILDDLAHYPDWWPQVRAVAAAGDDRAVVVCRSALPYDLQLVLCPMVRTAEILQTGLDGDLVGWARWRLTPEPGRRTRLDFDQQVRIAGRALAVAALVARPLLEWNHRRMMLGCRRGLDRQLRGAPPSGG